MLWRMITTHAHQNSATVTAAATATLANVAFHVDVEASVGDLLASAGSWQWRFGSLGRMLC
jgi:hypothetical protein